MRRNVKGLEWLKKQYAEDGNKQYVDDMKDLKRQLNRVINEARFEEEICLCEFIAANRQLFSISISF